MSKQVAKFNFRGVNININAQDVGRFKKLIEFPFDSVLVRLKCNNKVQLVKSFKLFVLAIIIVRRVDGKTKVNPYRDVDKVWHMALLYTTKYRNFCMEVAGFFIDHDPDMSVENLVRLTTDEYHELANLFYTLSPEHNGFFDSIFRSCCLAAKSDNDSYNNYAWIFQIEFEEIDGIISLQDGICPMYNGVMYGLLRIPIPLGIHFL